MGFEVNEISAKSSGGTELMQRGLAARLDVEDSVMNQFQIISSRVRELQEDKIRVLWLHDLPGDPESEHLRNGGHERFHQLVFVSNWQMQQYIAYYGIPWHKCVVIENAVEPILSPDQVEGKFTADNINLIYHTTPHRGLEILVPVFEKLCEKHSNITLDVFSSFRVYGWEQRDEPYRELFDRCEAHPNINYHGAVPNERVREALKHAHIFAYPSIWVETSCISMMEAMTAGCISVHSNLGALYETAGGTTMMYQLHENKAHHASMLYNHLDAAISDLKTNPDQLRHLSKVSCSYASMRYGWGAAVSKWKGMLLSLASGYPTLEDRKLPVPMFNYKIG